MKGLRAILLFAPLVVSLVAVACVPASSPTAQPSAAPSQSKPVGSTAASAQPVPSQPVGSTAASAQPAPSQPAAPPSKIRFTTTGGRGRIPISLVQKLGLDKKYNISIDLTIPANVDAMHTALVGGATDVIVTGWTNAVSYRSRGVPMVAVYPANSFLYDVIVAKDSPMKDFGDLRGKRVGTFATPASATTVLWAMECREIFGFDPYKEAKVQDGAATLLLQLLERGEIDAALLLDPQATVALAGGRFKSIGEIGEIWEKNKGQKLLATTIVSTDDFVKKNPEPLR